MRERENIWGNGMVIRFGGHRIYSILPFYYVFLPTLLFRYPLHAACGDEQGGKGAGDTPDPGMRTASPCTPCSTVTCPQRLATNRARGHRSAARQLLQK